MFTAVLLNFEFMTVEYMAKTGGADTQPVLTVAC
jgi:hypothetical protein